MDWHINICQFANSWIDSNPRFPFPFGSFTFVSHLAINQESRFHTAGEGKHVYNYVSRANQLSLGNHRDGLIVSCCGSLKPKKLI